MKRFLTTLLLLIPALCIAVNRRPTWPIAVVGTATQQWVVDSMNTANSGYRFVRVSSDPTGTGKYQQICFLDNRAFADSDYAPAGYTDQTVVVNTSTVRRIRKIHIISPTKSSITFAMFQIMDTALAGRFDQFTSFSKIPRTRRRAFIHDKSWDNNGTSASEITADFKRAVRKGFVTDFSFQVNWATREVWNPPSPPRYYRGIDSLKSRGDYVAMLDSLMTWAGNFGTSMIPSGWHSSKNPGPGTYYGAPDDRTLGQYTCAIPLWNTRASPPLLTVHAAETTSTAGGNKEYIQLPTLSLLSPSDDIARLYMLRYEYKRDTTVATKFYLRWQRDPAKYTTNPVLSGQDPLDGKVCMATYSGIDTSYVADYLYVETLETNQWEVAINCATGKVRVKNVTLQERAPDASYHGNTYAVPTLPGAFRSPPAGKFLFVGHGKTPFDGSENPLYESAGLRTFINGRSKNILDAWRTPYPQTVKAVQLVGDEVHQELWDPSSIAAYPSVGAAWADFVGDEAEYVYNYSGQEHACWMLGDHLCSWLNGRQFIYANNPKNGGFICARDSLASRKDYITPVIWGLNGITSPPPRTNVVTVENELAGWDWIAAISWEDVNGNGQVEEADSAAVWWNTLPADTIREHGIGYIGYPMFNYTTVFDSTQSKWW